jgi:hypothetical protein
MGIILGQLEWWGIVSRRILRLNKNNHFHLLISNFKFKGLASQNLQILESDSFKLVLVFLKI